MTNQLDNYFTYVLNTETTSEFVFIQTLIKHPEHFRSALLKNWQSRVDDELKEISQHATRKEPQAAASTGEEENDESPQGSDDDDLGEDEGAESQPASAPPTPTPSKQSSKITVDPIRRSDRLLRLLYHAYGENGEFFDLYANTLATLVKVDEENLSTIGLQQLACHVFERPNDVQRLERLVPSRSSPIVETIRHYAQENPLRAEDLQILYPASGRFLDARTEFRDSTGYFLDGDSLLLAVLHQEEIDASSLHVIFVIERILSTLFQQANQTNFILVFFDFYAKIYEENSSQLNLVRSAVIAHFQRNGSRTQSIDVKEFVSWLDDEYLKFVQEEKPNLVFYHDLSNLQIAKKNLLSAESWERLTILAHLYGNYHQYFLECQLFLLNKTFLSATNVQCFQLQFSRLCPLTLFQRLLPKVEREKVIATPSNWPIGDDVRLSIYLQTISELGDENQLEKEFGALFLLHVSLLVRLSLLDRHLPRSVRRWKFSVEFERFEKRLAKTVARIAAAPVDRCEKIGDIFDRRLFAFTLDEIRRQGATFRLDSTTKTFLQRSFDALKFSFDDISFPTLVERLIEEKKLQIDEELEEQTSTNGTPSATLIRIENPLIDAFVQPIVESKQLEFVEAEDQYLSGSNDRQVWSDYKEVGDEISRIPDNVESEKKNQKYRFRTRSQQKLSEYYRLYGESLTTRDVQDHQYRIVLPKCVEETTTSAAPSTSKATEKKKAKTTVSKADLIRQKNLEKKAEKRDDEEATRLQSVDARLRQIPAEDFVKMIEELEASLPSFKSTTFRLEILQRKFDQQRRYLRALRRKSQLTIEEQSKLELLRISYFATLCEMTDLENNSNPFETKLKFMDELVGGSSLTKNDWYRFQLETINSRLPRREMNEVDPRVPEYRPDRWQRNFLDAVDEEKSIVIVAPTASGKTYSSYYAMQQVQKKSSSGVCVYVAPSKALINQVTGTIYTNCGPNLGVFTPDYRLNVTKCRILVTTPDCFEMLLLSAEHQRWCQRIRYCIFDEIHCMSGEPGSEVWERILLLINCPMIGLSATVNNGEQVRRWIEHVEGQRQKLFQEKKAREVVFIDHQERLADLNKYLYSNRQLVPLHPVSLLGGKQLLRHGLPADLSFSPAETLRLHEKLTEETKRPAQIDSFFSPDWIVERTRANDYSKHVRQSFKDLLKTQNSTKIEAICSLNAPIEYPEMKPMATLIGEFVLTLKEKNMLPCIIFTDSRSLCEDLAESVTQYFEKLEDDLRRTKYKKRIEAIEKRLEMLEKADRKTSKVKKTAGSSRRDENGEKEEDNLPTDLKRMEEEDRSNSRLSAFDQELLYGTLEEATLANLSGCNRDLKERLIRRASTRNPRLIRYINRGVAYHQPRLRNVERLAVEGLFRNRYVQLIFSTWTLALGVHMPTRTVAFVKDSMSLDALQFRQSAGRSGRRGFDVQGNVVFLDIPLPKIRHLTLSSIPNIRTDLPLSVSYLLRLLNFYNRAEDKRDALNRSLISIQCPFAREHRRTTASDSIVSAMRYHCLSTVDLLYRLNLLDEHGNLIGLAGLAMHLHRAEPANLLLAYLIDTKLFHRLSDEDELINLFAYLFSHRTWFITRDQSRREKLFNKKRALRPLSNEILRRIRSYNDLVRQTLGVYLENVLQHLRSTYPDAVEALPFSGVSFGQPTDYDDGSFEYQLHHHHSEQKKNPSISPFAGLSGLTHAELLRHFSPSVNTWHLPFDLDLSSRLVPMIDVDARDSNGASYYFNGYLVDFFRYGSETRLMNEYGIAQDELYQPLREFQFVLNSLSRSLRSVVADNEFLSVVSKKMARLDQTFARQFYATFK